MSARATVETKLRLSPTDDAALREAARAEGLGLSEYVAGLVRGRAHTRPGDGLQTLSLLASRVARLLDDADAKHDTEGGVFYTDLKIRIARWLLAAHGHYAAQVDALPPDRWGA